MAEEGQLRLSNDSQRLETLLFAMKAKTDKYNSERPRVAAASTRVIPKSANPTVASSIDNLVIPPVGPKAPPQPRGHHGDLPHRSLAVKRPPPGCPPCPKVLAKVAAAASVLPKVLGTSVVYNEIYISEYLMPPWYYWIVVSFAVLVLLLALLKVRDLIRDREWSARCISWCGRSRSKKLHMKAHEFREEWDRVNAMLDSSTDVPPASEAWTMVPDEVNSREEEEEAPIPEQPINLLTAGTIDGVPKLQVVPDCRRSRLKNHHVCRLDKVLGIGTEYWCKNCISIRNITDADPELLKELFCHQGKVEVRKASLFLPLGSCPAVVRGKLQPHEDVADPPVDKRMQPKEKQKHLQHIWLHSRCKPSTVEHWEDRAAQHESILHRNRLAAPRFLLDPEYCGSLSGALIWRYSCKFDTALGFGLSDWCSLFTDVSNRLGWKIMTRMPQSRGMLARRSLFGLVYLHRWARITDAQGHGSRVASTGHAFRRAREECALCRRPDFLNIWVVCARRCCFNCLANLPMWNDPPDTLFCFLCHSQSVAKDKNL